jgi:predicted RNase H-like HicB family nuclease
MNSREVPRLLEAAGWRVVAVRGSHHRLKHPDRPGRVVLAASQARSADRHPALDRAAERRDAHEEARRGDPCAVVHKEPGSDDGVSFPEFPSCVTAGATLDVAVALAHDALALHLVGMAADGDPPPARPRTVAEVPAHPELAGGTPYLVEINPSDGVSDARHG